jgi:NADH:ubiquinone oxidoreductase subunit K
MLRFLAENPPGLIHWLVVSALLFSIGIYGLLTRRNALGALMSVELILNSGALNFVVFNKFVAPAAVDGKIMALFVIALAAAEVIVAMAIFVMLYRERKTVDLTQMDALRR